MSFPISHLLIANKLLENRQFIINNLPQFYLGSLAPDAVQFSEVYDKKKSHLIYSDEIWGFVTENDKWQNDVLDFLTANLETAESDFLQGYCIHILTDISNNIRVWTSYRLSSQLSKNDNIYNSKYHKEQFMVDQELYQKTPFIDEIFRQLENSVCFDFMNLVTKEEMEKIKKNILHVQYNNKPLAYTVDFKEFTYSQMPEFIKNTVDYIGKTIPPVIKKGHHKNA